MEIDQWSFVDMFGREEMTVEGLAPREWNPKAEVICLVLFCEEEGRSDLFGDDL